jgi:hypothetical protein
MNSVAEHEFIKNKNGELALLLDVLSFEDAVDPVLLVSREENSAYLYRGPNDIHKIEGINPDIINEVRAVQNVLVVELTGKNVTHSYDALTGIFEEDDEDGDEQDQTETE